MTVNKKEIADLLSLTTRQIANLVTDDVLSSDKKGMFDVKKSVRAYIKYKEDTLKEKYSTSDLDDRLTQVRIEKIENENLKLKIEIDKLESEKIDCSLAMSAWGKIVELIRGTLLNIPNKTAPLIAGSTPPEAQKILTEQIHDALTYLANPDLSDIQKLENELNRERAKKRSKNS